MGLLNQLEGRLSAQGLLQGAKSTNDEEKQISISTQRILLKPLHFIKPKIMLCPQKRKVGKY